MNGWEPSDSDVLIASYDFDEADDIAAQHLQAATLLGLGAVIVISPEPPHDEAWLARVSSGDMPSLLTMRLYAPAEPVTFDRSS